MTPTLSKGGEKKAVGISVDEIESHFRGSPGQLMF